MTGPTYSPELVVVGDGVQSRYVNDIRDGLPAAVVVSIDTPPADVVAFGAPFIVCHGDPQIKRETAVRIVDAGGELCSGIVHPRATVSRAARVLEGVIVNAGAVVQPGATIGPGVMIHANAVIDHGTNVRAYTSVGPGAILCGGITTGFGVYIGAGAIIMPNVIVGEYAIVGAGALVRESVPNGITVVGVPARPVARV